MLITQLWDSIKISSYIHDTVSNAKKYVANQISEYSILYFSAEQFFLPHRPVTLQGIQLLQQWCWNILTQIECPFHHQAIIAIQQTYKGEHWRGGMEMQIWWYAIFSWDFNTHVITYRDVTQVINCTELMPLETNKKVCDISGSHGTIYSHLQIRNSCNYTLT